MDKKNFIIYFVPEFYAIYMGLENPVVGDIDYICAGHTLPQFHANFR